MISYHPCVFFCLEQEQQSITLGRLVKARKGLKAIMQDVVWGKGVTVRLLFCHTRFVFISKWVLD